MKEGKKEQKAEKFCRRKIDLHLHLSRYQLPKLGKMHISSAKNMLSHLEELGIEKGA